MLKSTSCPSLELGDATSLPINILEIRVQPDIVTSPSPFYWRITWKRYFVSIIVTVMNSF